MIIISNSSPLIALSRIQKLDILKHLFGKIVIPTSGYQETVLQSHDRVQKETILQAIEDFIIVTKPKTVHSFKRTIDLGEKDELNLAFDTHADLLIIDEKKARNEAQELGFRVIKLQQSLNRQKHYN